MRSVGATVSRCAPKAMCGSPSPATDAPEVARVAADAAPRCRPRGRRPRAPSRCPMTASAMPRSCLNGLRILVYCRKSSVSRSRDGARRVDHFLRCPAIAAPTKSRNSGCGLVGRLLNSGWNWQATNHGMVRQLDELHQALVGGRAADDQAGLQQLLPEDVVDLVAVAVPLVDDLLAVGLEGLGARHHLGRRGAQAHGAAHVGDVLLLGQQVDDRVRASTGRTPRSWRRACRPRCGRTRPPPPAGPGRGRGRARLFSRA